MCWRARPIATFKLAILINFIDTAAAYGDGESERRIGLALSELGSLPAGYVLASKADRNLQTGDFDRFHRYGRSLWRWRERAPDRAGAERVGQPAGGLCAGEQGRSQPSNWRF